MIIMNFVQYFVTICKVKARADFERLSNAALCVLIYFILEKGQGSCCRSRVPGSNSRFIQPMPTFWKSDSKGKKKRLAFLEILCKHGNYLCKHGNYNPLYKKGINYILVNYILIYFFQLFSPLVYIWKFVTFICFFSKF